jgi:hypothetical protein
MSSKSVLNCALKIVLLFICAALVGLLLAFCSVIAQGAPVVPLSSGCSTDSECAAIDPAGNGDPEVGSGFLFCPEPDVSMPVIAPNGALIKFS